IDVNNVAKDEASANQLVRGGSLAGDVEKVVTVPVEGGVDQVGFNLMTADKLEQVSLIDPSGKKVDVEVDSVLSHEGYFPGAYHTSITKELPEAGEWHIELTVGTDSAYLLTVDYDTSQKIKSVKKATDDKVGLKHNDSFVYQLEVDPNQVEPSSLKATYRITDTKHPENSKTLSTGGKADLSRSLSFDHGDTVYNLTIDVSGKTKSGDVFKRTVIDSVYIGD
ncbi:MAG TPA: hypothetical protein VK142_05765, partial [Bacillota bacterium]|nr:hypothetical protein [Bacillota bacterium]